MSYLLDKKVKQKKSLKYFFIIFLFFIVLYFSTGVFNFLGSITHFIFKPIINAGNNLGDNVNNLVDYFSSKKELAILYEKSLADINNLNAKMANYNEILEENMSLKESLNRTSQDKNFLLSSILVKPNSSPYDTLIVDVGEKHGVKIGDLVFVFGNIPVGKIAEVYDKTSKVILFSNSKEGTEVSLDQVYFKMIGRGGGNFEIDLPRDFEIEKGAEVVLPGITPYTVAIFEKIISDPRDSFARALFVSPVNIQEIKFVEIQRNEF